MKKTLQKTLAVVMVIAMIFSQMAIMSLAAEVYEEITLGSVETVTLTEENNSVTVKFIPTESGNYIVTSDNGGDDDNIDPRVWVYDIDFNVIADDDDDGEGYNFVCGFYAEAGETYYIQLSAYDDNVEYNYLVSKNPVQSITGVAQNKLIEGYHGYWDTEWDEENDCELEYFRYDPNYADIIFTVTYADGSVYTGDEDEIEEQTGYWPDTYYSQTYDNQWDIGVNECRIALLGVESICEIEVVEHPVASITAVATNNLVEGINGYYTTDSLYGEDGEYIGETDKYFYYNLDEADLEYTVTYKDGTVYKGDSWEIHEQTDYDIGVNYSQSYDNQFVIGNNDVPISFLGYESTAQVKVLESPLDYLIVDDITLIKNADGYWSCDEEWDEELEEWVRYNEYFHYQVVPSYTAVMKDGTRYESDSDGDILYNDCWIGMYYAIDQSYENQWDIGEYEINATFMGQEVSFTVEVIETPIENMTFTPVRDLIIGLDDYEDYYYWNDFNVVIEYKDGTVEECLASDLYREYGYECQVSDIEFVSDYVSVGTVEFMGYKGEFEVTFIDNPYESITISGTNELVISFNKPDGTSDVAKVNQCQWFRGGAGVAAGYIYTDKGEYPAYYYYDFDEETEIEYPTKNVRISIGEMESNTLEEHNWLHAFTMSQDLYGIIQMYQDDVCEHYYDREFTGLDIANSNYNITDIGTISAMNLGWEYEYEFYEEEVNDSYYYYMVFDADDVIEMIEETFNVSNVDITKHAGYRSADHTVLIPEWGGYGDVSDINYSLEYIGGKWYATRELYWYYSGKTEYINLVLSDDILVEKITFGNQSLNGWINENGKWAYYDNGIKLTNQWKADSQGWCYLGADGYMLTNALAKDSHGWCFVGSNGYIVYNKWVQYDGKWYFIDSNGYTVSNQWKKDSQGWCYLGSDGAMLTNAWVKDSTGWCYVSSSGYIVYNQWVNDGGKWYFVDANGYMVSNQWRKDSQGWCYLGSDGAMLTNEWVKDSQGWCYVDSSGYIVYNQWVNDDGKRYFVDANGYMVTNKWLKDGDDWYYVGANGSCLTNQWMKDSIGWCFLDENGKMVTNAMVTDSHGICFVGEDGYWQSNVIIDDGNGYLYFDETGYLATDVVVYDGIGYRYFDETGYMVTDTWLTIEGESVYVDSNGYLDI